MALFGKQKDKKKQPAAPVVEAAPPVKDEDIHVMPQRYYVAPKVKKPVNWVVIGLAGTAVVAVVVVVVIFFSVQQDNRPAPQVVTGEDQQAPSVVEQQPAETDDEARLVVEGDEEDIQTETPTDTAAEQPTTEDGDDSDEPGPADQPPTVDVSLAQGPDADRDGLTDVEEVLFGTDRAKPDTDTDGYLDSEELKNGYSPLAAGQTAVEADSVAQYQHSDGSFSLLYPALWRVEGGDDTATFLSPTTTDFIEVVYYPNVIVSLERWYQENVTSNTAVPRLQTDNGWQIMRSADQRTVYLKSTSSRTVYVVTYDTGTEQRINFSTTFLMLLNSITES